MMANYFQPNMPDVTGFYSLVHAENNFKSAFSMGVRRLIVAKATLSQIFTTL
jgi:hypothetical protein